jgi:hypothetical protein
MENISSEEELKALLEEGKISQEEYEQLLEAMRKKPHPPVQQINSAPTKSKAKHGLGIIAFFLMLAGIIATVLGFLLILIGIVPKMGMLLVFLVFAVEVLALILGVFAFSSGWGKAAAICAPCYSFLVLPVVILVVIYFATQSQLTEIQEEPLPAAMVSHKYWPLDSLEGLLTRSNVKLDSNVSADGNGSLKIQSQESGTIRLFETGPMSIQNRLIFYSAKLRSEALEGKAFLEMWCNIPGRGEFFSRGLDQPISGTTEWTSVQTPFRLEAGQIPGNVKLNIVIEGSGTVWIDDIQLLSSPLN